MKKGMKKILAVILAVSMLFSSGCLSVRADEPVREEDADATLMDAETDAPEEAAADVDEDSEDYQAVKAQYDALDDYDNISILQDITFPSGSGGVTITYQSSQEGVLTSAGHIVSQVLVDTPVVVTATLTKNDVTMTRNLRIVILTVHDPDEVAAELGERSRTRMLELCENTAEYFQTSGQIARNADQMKPGQRSQDSLNEFRREIEECRTVKNGNLAAQRLLQAGIAFIESVQTDNTPKEGEEKKSAYREQGRDLVYSTYRARLEGYVFKAKGLLLINPELHPLAAKNVLEQQIARSERVLQEGYEHPYVKTREFDTNMDDDAIQYTTDIRKFICNFNDDQGWRYGMMRAIDWYQQSDVLSDYYGIMEADTNFATVVTPKSVGSSASSDLSVGGEGEQAQYAYAQFDLSKVPESFVDARLAIGGGQGYLDFYLGKNYTWPNVTVKNLFSQNKLKDQQPAGHYNYIFDTAQDLSGIRRYPYVTNAAATAASKSDKTLTLTIGGMDGESVHLYGNASATLPLTLQFQLDTVDRLALQKECEKQIKLKEELVTADVVGYEQKSTETVGMYSQAAIDALRESIDQLRSIYKDNTVSPFTVGIALADVHTKYRELRDSICIRTQVEPNSTVFYAEDELKEFRNTFKADPTFLDIKENVDKNEMSTVREMAEATGMNGSVEKYNALLDKYPAWSTTEYGITTPEGTEKAYITLTLDGRDNETNVNGIGHAWVDNLTAHKTVDGKDISLTLPNPSFEDGSDTVVDGKTVRSKVDKWTSKVTGNGKTSVYNRLNDGYGLAASGNYSLYMENPDRDSSVTWTSATFDIDNAQSYTFYLTVRNIGVMEYQGITMQIHYLDKDGQETGISPEIYNKTKSYTYSFTSTPNILMQQAAICYQVTNDRTYAEYAKHFLSIFMNDHLQGTQTWQIHNYRPNGIDAYGAVQAGRNASSIANTYSIIRNVDGLYEDEEREYLMRQFELLTDMLMDLRDRTEITEDDNEGWGGNWEMDEAAGAAQIAIAALDDGTGHAHLDYSVQYIDNGRRVNEEQMKNVYRDDGGYPESIRYHVECTQKYLILAKAYRNLINFDMFADPTYRLSKALEFMVNQQTPAYSGNGGRISYPPIGDDSQSDGNAFFLCGLYYDEIYKLDPALGLKLYVTWVRAGRPLPGLWNGEQSYAQLFFGRTLDLSEYDDQWAQVLNLKTSDATTEWGNYIMRNNFDSKETYISFNNFKNAIAHGHYDQMSFIMYADNVPLVVDPGINSYWDSHWYRETPAHSLLQFDRNGGFYAGGPGSSVNKDWFTSDYMDYISAQNPDGNWTRNFAFWKGGFEAVVIWDKVTPGTVTRSNYTLSTAKTYADGGITFDGTNKFTAKCFNNIDLELTFLKGNPESYEVEASHAASGTLPVRANADDPVVDVLRVTSAVREDYFTVLFPKTAARGSLDVKTLYQEDGVTVAGLTHSAGNKLYVAVNNGTEDKTVEVVNQSLVNARTGSVVTGSSVRIPAGEILIMYPQGQNNATFTGTTTSGSGSGNSASGGATITGGGMTGSAGNQSGNTETKPDDGAQMPAADASAQVYRNMAAGQKGSIAIPSDPNVNVQLVSSKPEIASVSQSGDIRALKAGKTDIGIYVTKGGVTTKTTITLKVVNKKKVPGTVRALGSVVTTDAGTPVTELTKEMSVNETSSFRIVKDGSAKVSYSVKNSGIARVSDNGTITAKKAGTTRVIAKVSLNGQVQKYRILLTVEK